MKSQAEILNLLRRYKPTAQKKYGLTKLGIFGSVARGEQACLGRESLEMEYTFDTQQ